MLSIENRKLVVRQYGLGVPPSETAREFGISVPNVVMIARRAGMPAQRRDMSDKARRARQRMEMKGTLREKRAAGIERVQSSGEAELGWAMLRDLIPDDTRSLTAWICGDPLPGRSALDRRAG